MSAPVAGRAWLARLLLVLVALGAFAAVAVALQRGATEQMGPRPIAWGKEPCAHCRMLIGEPRHAAQVVLRDGSAKSFDDPGCLFSYLRETRDDVAQRYFRHGRQDRWLTAPAVAFERGASTPMGFGLLAVDPGTPSALSLQDAAAELHARSRSGGGH